MYLGRVDGLTDLLECVKGMLKIVLREAAGDSIGPLDLTARDGVQRRASARRERRQFRSLVRGIGGVQHQALGFEEVSCSLHALPRQSHSAADFGDGSRRLVERSEHLPPRAGLTVGTRNRIPSAEKAAIQSKDFEYEFGKNATRNGVLH
jgi:hypothetical protein